MRSINDASSMTAISANRPPHLGHASVSMPKLRRIRSAQSRVSPRDGRPAPNAPSAALDAVPRTLTPAPLGQLFGQKRQRFGEWISGRHSDPRR
jgi:hypothetical protein